MIAPKMIETSHQGIAMPSSCSNIDDANVPPAHTR
jgi:hypothetical protein